MVRLIIFHVGITHVAIRLYPNGYAADQSTATAIDLKRLVLLALHAIILGDTDGFREVESSNFGMRACM